MLITAATGVALVGRVRLPEAQLELGATVVITGSLRKHVLGVEYVDGVRDVLQRDKASLLPPLEALRVPLRLFRGAPVPVSVGSEACARPFSVPLFAPSSISFLIASSCGLIKLSFAIDLLE